MLKKYFVLEKLSEDDLLQAAKRTSDVTQFTFDANQLPIGSET